jgi:hypothetical protein
MTVHKRKTANSRPLVSIILLDWTCRERFQALEWLPKQTVPRDQYELIWIELFNRVVPAAMENADIVITCNQKGTYHKHEGYNAGVLEAQGEVVTVCDSDAVFPPNFIESIIDTFQAGKGQTKSMVLMHHEWRSKSEYPDDLKTFDQLSNYKWQNSWPNVGACLSVQRADAIRFGGFDEHHSFRGYICGPYELGWRLVNAGLPEIWYDDNSVALWHFAHPRTSYPIAPRRQFSIDGLKRFFEVKYPHFDYHAMTAVEAFSAGRLLPLRENPEIHRLRMSQRQIGSAFERNYSNRSGPEGFTIGQRLQLRLSLMRETFQRLSGFPVMLLEKCLGTERFEILKERWRSR